jgi:hypothetical protein
MKNIAKITTYSIILIFATCFCILAGPLPDTGQTTCYDNDSEITCPAPGEAFYGQDASYTINPPSYSKLDANGNDLPDSAASWSMVRDDVTGLIWEVKTDDGSIHDKDNKYTWYDSNPATNGGHAGMPGDGTDSEDFINTLNSANFGGFSDWRLPTIKELSTIVNIETWSPSINTYYFPNTASSDCYYWSSTTHAYDNSKAWKMGFFAGDMLNSGLTKSLFHYARAVRGGLFLGENNFVVNDDGTVTDTATGLMWQQLSSGSMIWNAAVTYCENLSLAGYNDWRMPNRKEIQSLVDYSKYSPAINTTAFDITHSDYFSSTINPNSPDWGYCYSLWDGSIWLDDMFVFRYVRAVRGGQNLLSDHFVIYSPVQGAIYRIGNVQTIVWDDKSIGGNIKISLSRQGGKTGTFETIIESTENNGTYSWNITGPVSPNCILKIEPLSNPIKQTNQGLFTIGPTVLPVATISDVPEGLTNQNSTTITVGGDFITSYKYKIDNGNYGYAICLPNTINLVDLSDGSHTIYVLGRDAAGDWQSTDTPTTASWTVDTTPPEAPNVSGNTPTNNVTPTWTWNSGNGDGIGTYRYKLDDNDLSIGATETTSTSYTPELNLDIGSHTLYVQERDEAGNWSTSGFFTIIIDIFGPSGSISINGGDTFANSNSVSLSLSASDTSGVSKMRFSNDGANFTDPENYSSSKTWPLSPGDGNKTVYVQYKDNAGNWSSSYTDTIIVDTTPPITAINSSEYSNGASITITWSANDGDGSGVQGTTFFYKRGAGANWSSETLVGTQGTFDFTNLSGDGDYYFTLVSEDNLGNKTDPDPPPIDPSYVVNNPAVSHTVYDTAKPSSEASSPSTVNDLNKTFTVSYTYDDNFSGVLQVELYVKVPGESGYALVDTDPEGSVDDKFSYTAIDEGGYFFYTKATDKAGNVELPPDGYDTETIYASQFAGYAILAVGSIYEEEGLESHTITDDEVITGKDDYSEGGTISYKDAIEKAVTQWALNKMNVLSGPLYIILIDHGTHDAFSLTAIEYFDSQTMDGWLNTLEAAMVAEEINQPIVVVLGSCYSGSFMANLSKSGRIIVASTADDEPSYRGPMTPTGVRDGEFFISALFNEWGKGIDLKASFERAVGQTEAHTDSGTTNSPAPYFDTAMQHPYLDDDGQFPWGAPDPVFITEVGKEPVTPLGPTETQATLWAKVSDSLSTDSVWVEIREPDVTLEAGTEQQVVDLIEVDLIQAGDRYESLYTEFNKAGRYTLFFYAKDNSGIISPFVTTYLYKEIAENQPPGAFSLLSPDNGSSTTSYSTSVKG